MTVITRKATAGKWSEAASWEPAQVPTEADDVVFNATSALTEISVEAKARSLDMTSYPEGKALTLNAALVLGTSTANASNFIFKGSTAANTMAGNNVIKFKSTASTAQKITMNKCQIKGNSFFEGTAVYLLESETTYKTAEITITTSGGLKLGTVQMIPTLIWVTSPGVLFYEKGKITCTAANANTYKVTGTVNAEEGTLELTGAGSVGIWMGGSIVNSLIVGSSVTPLLINQAGTINKLETQGNLARIIEIENGITVTITESWIDGHTSVKWKLTTKTINGQSKIKGNFRIAIDWVDMNGINAEGTGLPYEAGPHATRHDLGTSISTNWTFPTEENYTPVWKQIPPTQNTPRGIGNARRRPWPPNVWEYPAGEPKPAGGAFVTHGGGNTVFTSFTTEEGKEVTHGGGATRFTSGALIEGKEVTHGGGKTSTAGGAVREGQEVTHGGGKTATSGGAVREGKEVTKGGGRTTYQSAAVREGAEVTHGGGRTTIQSGAVREGQAITHGGGRTAFSGGAVREGAEVTHGGGRTTFTGFPETAGATVSTHGGGSTTIPIHEPQQFLGWQNVVKGLGFTPVQRPLAYKVVATATHIVNTIAFKTTNGLEPGNVAIMSDSAGKPNAVLRELAHPFKFAPGEETWTFHFADLELIEGTTYYLVVNFTEGLTTLTSGKPPTITAYWGKHNDTKISEETEWEAKTVAPFMMWATWQASVINHGGGQTRFTSTATDVGREGTHGGGQTTFQSGALREGKEVTHGGGQTILQSYAERAGAEVTHGGGRTATSGGALRQGAETSHGGGRTTFLGGAVREGVEATRGGGRTILAGAVQTATTVATHGGGLTRFSSYAPREGSLTTHGGGRTLITGAAAVAQASVTHGGGRTVFITQEQPGGAEVTRGGGQTKFVSYAIREGSLRTSGGGRTKFVTGIAQGSAFATHGGGRTSTASSVPPAAILITHGGGRTRFSHPQPPVFLVTHGGGRTLFRSNVQLGWVSAVASSLTAYPATIAPPPGSAAVAPEPSQASVVVTDAGGQTAEADSPTPFPATIGASDL